jgi:hypothetical protein
MGVAKPDKPHYSRNMSMMWGVDPADGLWAAAAVDSSGFSYQKGYVKDPETLDWIPATQPGVVSQYKISDMDTAGTAQYYGFVGAGGTWYIMEYNTSLNTFRYCKGDSAYATAWTGRAGLSYGLFSAIF